MFTGLIETICVVKSVRSGADSSVLAVDMGELAPGTRTGDSIAISGVCLTVTRIEGNLVSFDISAETLAKSTLSVFKFPVP